MPISIRELTPEQTLPLRAEILRPDVPLYKVNFAGDDAPGARHFGAFEGEELIGVAFISPSSFEGQFAFQLRGVAVCETARGSGVGTLLVRAGLAAAGENPVWCNARTGATGLYKKLGFQTLGDEFEIEGIGPHLLMVRRPTNHP